MTHLPRPETRFLVSFLAFALAGCPEKKNDDDDDNTPCAEGTAGCPCRATNPCDTGLTCTNNVCTATGAGGLVIGNAAVRSCDVLLTVANASAVQATFGSGVVGKSRAKGDKLGLSFLSRTDAVPTAVVELKDAAGAVVPFSTVTVAEATCYDHLGAAVATPQVTLR
ncbi:MAG: hypothetical protein HY904_00435 [Deltaproteobacteria bacterium]|nr:hypothetical protein [Deltaproteobacteria bacterium]